MSHDVGGHGGGGSAWAPLWWFLLIIVGLWILWYFTGGPQRAERDAMNPYMKAPNPIDSGETYNANPAH